jgi:hypothetical protein
MSENLLKRISSKNYGADEMKKLAGFLRDYAEDIFVGIGVVAITVATFRIDTTAGIYCIGVSSLAVGWFLARQPPRGR